MCGVPDSQRAEGKLDLTLWPNLPPAQIVAVKARIVDPDPNRRMPKAADGSAGLPLPWRDVQAFMCELRCRVVRFRIQPPLARERCRPLFDCFLERSRCPIRCRFASS